MPIAILGMPRSGGGFVAAALQKRGLAVVTEPGPGGGFASLNEALLTRLGGGWDRPVAWPAGDEWAPAVEPFHTAAATLAARCAATAAAEWGWHDPATTLTWPFWRRIVGGVRPLVVIRNPLEVLLSLRARLGCSVHAALEVVRGYQRAVLDTTTPAARVVTHFAAHARESTCETDRVLVALGCPPLPAPGDDRGFTPCLRHARLSRRRLPEFGLPDDIVADYDRLCAEAGFTDDGADEAESAADHDGLTWLRAGLAGLARIAPAGPAPVTSHPLQALQADVARLRSELADRDDALQEVLDDLRFSQGQATVSPGRLLYRQVVKRTRELVRERVSAGAVVAVISKGDDDLLRHRQVEAWHFPRDERGTFAGWYPAGDLAAIAHLEVLRSRGATHLLVPETYDWWLTTYAGFRAHLEARHRLVERRAGAGSLYELLAEPAAAAAGESAGGAIELIAAALGRLPQVLDLTGDRAPAGLFERAAPFTVPLPPPGAPLPHVDASVDIVAVAAPPDQLRSDARRVARLAVLDVAGEPAVEWLRALPAPHRPSVSIVMPVFNQWGVTRGCLAALQATLPRDQPVEIIVVDDGSTDDTPAALRALAAVEPRLKVLRSPGNAGFVASSNRGAAAATGTFLVFLNNDTVPLPGWLTALLGTFDTVPRVGAVGGRLLFPDGRLQEAGGIIFTDGSACHCGRGEADATAPPFDHLRPVDYVSGALLATPRSLFAALGGFDPDYAPGYYEDTDYCFRLREAGHGVWYQPEAVAVHLEGATAGTDPTAGMKRYQAINLERFRRRHARALEDQPEPLDAAQAVSWQRLVRRGKGGAAP
jgi:GT2 family glycosyltransferase